MTQADKLDAKITKLIESIRNLSFPFSNETRQGDFQGNKDEIIELLEDMVEMAGEDEDEKENEEEDDETS